MGSPCQGHLCRQPHSLGLREGMSSRWGQRAWAIIRTSCQVRAHPLDTVLCLSSCKSSQHIVGPCTDGCCDRGCTVDKANGKCNLHRNPKPSSPASHCKVRKCQLCSKKFSVGSDTHAHQADVIRVLCGRLRSSCAGSSIGHCARPPAAAAAADPGGAARPGSHRPAQPPAAAKGRPRRPHGPCKPCILSSSACSHVLWHWSKSDEARART